MKKSKYYAMVGKTFENSNSYNLFKFNLLKFLILSIFVFLISFEVKAEDLSSFEINELNSLIKEAKKRYPELKELNFTNMHSDDFKIAVVRSILAQKLYDEYKNNFIKKIKDKSITTGRSIIKSSEMNECDIDSEVKNIKKYDGVIYSYHLSNDKYDNDECFGDGRFGEKYGYRKCYIPDDWEEMIFSIGETNRDDLEFKSLSLLEENLNNNIAITTTITLNGRYETLDNNHFINTSLRINTTESSIHDRKSDNNKINSQIEQEVKFDVKEGIPSTKFDEDVSNAKFYIKENGINIKGEYRPGYTKE